MIYLPKEKTSSKKNADLELSIFQTGNFYISNSQNEKNRCNRARVRVRSSNFGSRLRFSDSNRFRLTAYHHLDSGMVATQFQLSDATVDVAATFHFRAESSINAIRVADRCQFRLHLFDGLNDGSPNGLSLRRCLAAQPFPADGNQGLSVSFKRIINQSTLWKFGSINSSSICSLSLNPMLNPNLMPNQMHHDKIRNICDSHFQSQQSDRAVFCQKDFSFPCRRWIFPILTSNCIHGSVLDGLPIILVINHFHFHSAVPLNLKFKSQKATI